MYVVLPPATANDYVVFGKNSIRPIGEVQEVVYIPAAHHCSGSTVKCTYIELEQASHVHAVVLSKPAGCWGAEMGANDSGVCIGCSMLVGCTNGSEGLTGCDLVRLGLERGSSAHAAVRTISDIVSAHGLGNATVSQLPSSASRVSLLVCDRTEAWVLEVCGKQWAAVRLTTGARWLSGDAFTIQSVFDDSSLDLQDFAIQHQLWLPDEGAFNFAKAYSVSGSVSDVRSQEHAAFFQEMVDKASGNFSVQNMLEVLRHADSEQLSLIDDGFIIAGSQVSVLPPPGGDTAAAGNKMPTCVHWLTATPRPTLSFFKPFIFSSSSAAAAEVCAKTSSPSGCPDSEHALWLAHGRFLSRLNNGDDPRASLAAKNVRELEQNCCEDVEDLVQSGDYGSGSGSPATSCLFEHMVNLEMNFY